MLLVALIILALVLFAGGFVIHWLFIAAVIVANDQQKRARSPALTSLPEGANIVCLRTVFALCEGYLKAMVTPTQEEDGRH